MCSLNITAAACEDGMTNPLSVVSHCLTEQPHGSNILQFIIFKTINSLNQGIWCFKSYDTEPKNKNLHSVGVQM